MVAHTRTWEAEVDDAEFKTSLGYIDNYLKKNWGGGKTGILGYCENKLSSQE